MNPQETLAILDQQIQARSILKHPFYLAWQRGELSREQLAIYARIYYPHVAAFPRYLKNAIDHTADPMVREELELNLADELTNPKAHNELWLDFAAGLGLERTSVNQAQPHPAAQNIVAAFSQLTQSGDAPALAALYAYESQQPEVARQKADGLRALYGVEDPETLAYFEIHARADLRHRAGERVALARCLDNGAPPEETLNATWQALGAYWSLLDGVCEEARISLTG